MSTRGPVGTQLIPQLWQRKPSRRSAVFLLQGQRRRECLLPMAGQNPLVGCALRHNLSYTCSSPTDAGPEYREGAICTAVVRIVRIESYKLGMTKAHNSVRTATNCSLRRWKQRCRRGCWASWWCWWPTGKSWPSIAAFSRLLGQNHVVPNRKRSANRGVL
jgi:hypothetical protein